MDKNFRVLSLCTLDHPFYKSTQMNALQAQVFRLGICPTCHTKNLRSGYFAGKVDMRSCICGTIFCLDR